MISRTSFKILNEKRVISSAVEKIDSGCERVMARIARDIDQARILHDDGWHGALLRRATEAVATVRTFHEEVRAFLIALTGSDAGGA